MWSKITLEVILSGGSIYICIQYLLRSTSFKNDLKRVRGETVKLSIKNLCILSPNKNLEKVLSK